MSGWRGKSKLITTLTEMISIPLANTSEETRQRVSPRLKSWKILDTTKRVSILIDGELRFGNLPVPVSLVHPRVDEEARVAKLADFARKQLNSLCTVAEDDGLRDVKFGEESVQTVEFLTLFKEGVVLGQTFQSQLVSDLDVLGSGHISLLELADFDWVSRTEKAALSIDWHHF